VELTNALQPTAAHLGGIMHLPDEPVRGFSEEVVRGTPAAPVSQVMGVAEPRCGTLLGSLGAALLGSPGAAHCWAA